MESSEPVAAPPGGSPLWQRRLAALCEFTGVLLAAIVAKRLLLGAFGVASWKGTQADMLATGEADFLRLAGLAAIDQGVKYGLLLALAFAIGWWHRRRRPARYGLTLAGRSWRSLFGVGVALWGVAFALPGLLQVLDDLLPWIGRGPDHWALFPSRWSGEFLLYLAASSFLLVPIVEELAVRGYLLNRLREDFPDLGALLLSSAFFALAHTQYFKLEVMSLGMTASIALGSLAAGYVLIRTGSIVPCIVAHALLNLPTPPGRWGEEIVLAAALAVVLAARHPVLRWARDLLALFRRHGDWRGTLAGLAALLGILAAILLFQGQAPILAAALLALGLAGDALDRRRRPAGV